MNDEARIRIDDRVTIVRRGQKGVFTAEFHWDGQHRRRSMKTSSEKVAKQRAMKLAVSLTDGTYARPIARVGVAELINNYLAYQATEHRATATLAKYRHDLKKFRVCLQQLGVTSIHQLTVRHFDEYRASCKAAGAHPKTMFTAAVVVKQLMKWAKSRRLIAENVLEHVKLEKPKTQPRPGPTLDQIDAILQRLDDTDKTAVAVMAFAGLRSGEVRRLQKQDVDRSGNWLQVLSREGLETKTRRSRKVPIHGRLQTMLDAVTGRARKWFLTNPTTAQTLDSDQPLDVNKLNQRFMAIVKKLGMPAGRNDVGFTLHSLRHFFETFTVNALVPQRVVDAWIGHTGDRSMGAIYYHLSDAESQKFMAGVPFSAAAATCPSHEEC